jgi:hypothetical protein
VADPVIGNVTLVTPAVVVQPLIAAVLLLGGAIVGAGWLFGTSEDIVTVFVGVDDPIVQYWRIKDDVEPFAFGTNT